MITTTSNTDIMKEVFIRNMNYSKNEWFEWLHIKHEQRNNDNSIHKYTFTDQVYLWLMFGEDSHHNSHEVLG